MTTIKEGDELARELEAKLNACRAEGLTFKCGWNLIDATIRALRSQHNGATQQFFEHLRANAPKSVDPAHSEDYKRGLADAHKLIVAAASAALGGMAHE